MPPSGVPVYEGPRPGFSHCLTGRNSCNMPVGDIRRVGKTMFKDSNSTVFILGAGASWHYGYPTGEMLVEKVIEKATVALKYFEHSVASGNPQLPNYLANAYQWLDAVEETKKLKNGLEQ